MVRVLRTGQAMSIAPLQMDWYWWTGLKCCSCKWTRRIITEYWQKRRKHQQALRASRFYQLFTYLFCHSFIRSPLEYPHWEWQSVAYHLTADGDLVGSDLKVPPDWFCPHSGAWWISPTLFSVYVFSAYPYLPSRQSHWWGLRSGGGHWPWPGCRRQETLVWPARWDADPVGLCLALRVPLQLLLMYSLTSVWRRRISIMRRISQKWLSLHKERGNWVQINGEVFFFLFFLSWRIEGSCFFFCFFSLTALLWCCSL